MKEKKIDDVIIQEDFQNNGKEIKITLKDNMHEEQCHAIVKFHMFKNCEATGKITPLFEVNYFPPKDDTVNNPYTEFRYYYGDGADTISDVNKILVELYKDYKFNQLKNGKCKTYDAKIDDLERINNMFKIIKEYDERLLKINRLTSPDERTTDGYKLSDKERLLSDTKPYIDSINKLFTKDNIINLLNNRNTIHLVLGYIIYIFSKDLLSNFIDTYKFIIDNLIDVEPVENYDLYDTDDFKLKFHSKQLHANHPVDYWASLINVNINLLGRLAFPFILHNNTVSLARAIHAEDQFELFEIYMKWNCYFMTMNHINELVYQFVYTVYDTGEYVEDTIKNDEISKWIDIILNTCDNQDNQGNKKKYVCIEILKALDRGVRYIKKQSNWDNCDTHIGEDFEDEVSLIDYIDNKLVPKYVSMVVDFECCKN